MAIVVQKFGGTSVGSPERIREAARRIARARAAGLRPVVVTSAMGRTTDTLLDMASSTAPGAAGRSRRELDLLLATGEQTAAALLALALEERGVPALSLTGAQAEILTDGNHGAARIRSVRARRVRSALDQGRVPVVAGFQGLSDAREVTTLGRGGSDTTAVALAVAVGARRCDIYTDVDGIYSADPRRVPGARRHDRLTHRDALLLAQAGAAVLHPRAAALAAAHRVPLRIVSSLDGRDDPTGTRIEGDEAMEGPRILGVTTTPDTVRLVLDAPAGAAAATARLLAGLATAGVAVEHLDDQRAPGGGRRLRATVPADRAEAARRAAAAALDTDVRIEHPLARINIVGSGLSAHGTGIARALQALAAVGIEPEGLGVTDLGITLYIEPAYAEEATRLLHAELLEDGAEPDAAPPAGTPVERKRA